MTHAQRIAAVLLQPELALKPEYGPFKELLREAVTTGDIDNETVERMAAALPQ